MASLGPTGSRMRAESGQASSGPDTVPGGNGQPDKRVRRRGPTTREPKAAPTSHSTTKEGVPA